MIIKHSVVFYPECRTTKKGTFRTSNVPIRLRLGYSRHRLSLSTGLNIDADRWDAERQSVKPGYVNKERLTSTEINAELRRLEGIIHEMFKEYEITDIVPPMGKIRAVYLERTQAETPKVVYKEDVVVPDFWAAMDLFVEEEKKKRGWAEGTCKKIKTAKNHLQNFRKKYMGNDELTYESFDEDCLNAFLQHLMDKENLRNDSVKKDIKVLKWFLRWALKKGYHNARYFMEWQPKIKHVQRTIVFLTEEEINKLRNCKIPASMAKLDRVRDVYLFCCFTGLRWSDVYNLRRSDIKGDCIEITTIKTSDTVAINLNKQSRAILDKYRDVHFRNDKALPVLTNQKMNEYLKVLGRLAKIDAPVHDIYFKKNQRVEEVRPKYDLLSTHTGRKTFISQAIQHGIPPEIIMQWTGHADYAAMKPYIALADNIKEEAMKKFDTI